MADDVLINGSNTLIENLLAEQAMLTAVEIFSKEHARGSILESRYRALLPATRPAAGQQYAFEVDLDRCSGCKACVTACHSLNGLDDDESWRSVGLLVSPVAPASRLEVAPVQQHVTTACHHCVDPGCLNGCPVLAYDKDPVTGVVRHLDDQCIGCSYCVMKCPYEVPRYSERLGIVRKCDMCSHRLAASEPPACAQACPSEAIRIVIVDQPELREQYAAAPAHGVSTERESPKSIRNAQSGAAEQTVALTDSFLPDSPDPRLTIPSTRFVSRRELPKEVKAADHEALRLDLAHGPLVTMLILTQTSAGLFLASTIRQWCGPTRAQETAVVNGIACLFLISGLFASVLHLGRPMKAWRAFLGWRRSWLSREIIVLNLFAAVAFATIVVQWLGIVTNASAAFGFASFASTTAAAGLGLIAVAASAMVYVDTGRQSWRARITFGNFFGSTILLGSYGSATVLTWLTAQSPASVTAVGRAMAVVGLANSFVVWAWRVFKMRRAAANPMDPAHWNARVVEELLPHRRRHAIGSSIVSMTFCVMALATTGFDSAGWMTAAMVAAFVSETVGRQIYFLAGGSCRMPGGAAL